MRVSVRGTAEPTVATRATGFDRARQRAGRHSSSVHSPSGPQITPWSGQQSSSLSHKSVHSPPDPQINPCSGQQSSSLSHGDQI